MSETLRMAIAELEQAREWQRDATMPKFAAGALLDHIAELRAGVTKSDLSERDAQELFELARLSLRSWLGSERDAMRAHELLKRIDAQLAERHEERTR